MKPSKLTCFICDSAEVNDLELGEFHKSGKIAVHYFCLLLTSGLVQNGEENHGIFGFLLKDIREEVARIKRLKCVYCKNIKANIGCCETRCRRTFHTNCGLQNDCLMQFEDPYRSYCHQHVIKQQVARGRGKQGARHPATEMCAICYDQMGAFNAVHSVHAPCCKKSWFHKRCLMEFAKNAGYFFKCPMCNNEDDFRIAVKQRGVFVPDRDAAWETEPNAFAELLERPESCEATDCVCPQGRDHESTKYKMLLCTLCGSHCVHNKCMTPAGDAFTCATCELPAAAGGDIVLRPTSGEEEEHVDIVGDDDDDDADVDGDSDDDDDDKEVHQATADLTSNSDDIDSTTDHRSVPNIAETKSPDRNDGIDSTCDHPAESDATADKSPRAGDHPTDGIDSTCDRPAKPPAPDPNASLPEVVFVETPRETIDISSDDDDVNTESGNGRNAGQENLHNGAQLRNDSGRIRAVVSGTTKRDRVSLDNETGDPDCKPPQSKRIRRALETMKNQSKITSFFSCLGAGSARAASDASAIDPSTSVTIPTSGPPSVYDANIPKRGVCIKTEPNACS